MKKIRVLQINAGSRNFGGVSAMLLNIYRNINKDIIEFDFLTPNKTTYSEYIDEIINIGGNVYEFNINNSTLFGKVKLCRRLKKFLLENKYDIIHINSGILLFNMIVAYTSKKYSNSKIIVHSHNAGRRSFIKKIFSYPIKKILEHKSDMLLSCSNLASRYMYTKKGMKRVKIIKNGINTNKFSYNEQIRDKKRKELKLENKLVIGNVGRFTSQKNHTFMINVFEELKKKCNAAVLVLIGQGELENNIKRLVSEKNLEDSVLFLGQRKDVNDMYQAMDVFFLPSLYEGFGIVNIEAQSSGLICVVSDSIPDEANVTGSTIRISLKEPISVWVNSLLEASKNERVNMSDKVKVSGYDIKITVSELEKIYIKILG